MDTSILLPSFFLLIVFITIMITVKNIWKNKKLTLREKNNYTFLQIFFPIIGSIFYFVSIRDK